MNKYFIFYKPSLFFTFLVCLFARPIQAATNPNLNKYSRSKPSSYSHPVHRPETVSDEQKYDFEDDEKKYAPYNSQVNDQKGVYYICKANSTTLASQTNYKSLKKVHTFHIYHLADGSYRPRRWAGEEEIVGIVLYSYNDKFDWDLNNIHCRSGYIILKRLADIMHIDSLEGTLSGKLYKSVFNKEIDKRKVLVTGFGRFQKVWKFADNTLNCPNIKADLSQEEEEEVKATLENWISKGEQNYQVERGISIFCDISKIKLIYGILVDVSGSMKRVLTTKDLKLKKKHVNRAHAVFDIIFKTIKEDDQNSHGPSLFRCFALAFGLKDSKNAHCDLFSLFEFLLSSYDTYDNCKAILAEYHIHDNVDQYIKIDEHNSIKCQIVGDKPLEEMAKEHRAPYAGKYIRQHLKSEECGHLFMHFHQNKELLPQMIDKLPDACKNRVNDIGASILNPNPHELANFMGVGENNRKRMNDSELSLFDRFSAFGKYTIGSSIFLSIQPLVKATEKAGEFAGAPQKESDAARKAFQEGKDLVLSPIYKLNRKPRSRKEIIAILDRLAKLYPLSSDDEKKSDDDEKKSDDELLEFDKLLDDIEKYIFGSTPMCESLRNARRIFESSNDSNEKRKLLIISDGKSTDGDPIPIAKSLQEDTLVMVICCFITDADIPNPKQLYYTKQAEWSKGAQNLFDMASSVGDSDPVISLLLKNGWQIPGVGENRLFIQANNADIIEQFCNIVKQIGSDTNHNTIDNTIMEMVGNYYNFDEYINNKLSETIPPDQNGETCYANAVALGLHLAMLRIVGRAPSIEGQEDSRYPGFKALRKSIIETYSTYGGETTEQVIDEYIQKHKLRLRYKEVMDEEEIRNVIAAGRILVAIFCLSYVESDNFRLFFEKNKEGILTKEEISKPSEYKYFQVVNNNTQTYRDISLKRSEKQLKNGDIIKGKYLDNKIVQIIELYGDRAKGYCSLRNIEEIDGHSMLGLSHAVVLVQCRENYLKFMNSWGYQWADQGFFRLKDKDVLQFKDLEKDEEYKMRFFDIYWEEEDLLPSEKEAFKQYSEQKMMDTMKELVPKSFYKLNYKCPVCDGISKINKYSGSLSQAICPKCSERFKPNGIGLVRSLDER